MPLKQLLGGLGLETPYVVRMVPVELVVPLIPGKNHLVGVQNDHKITRIRMPGIGRLMLAGDHPGDHGGQTAYDLVRIGGWALLVIGIAAVVLGLIRYAQRYRGTA